MGIILGIALTAVLGIMILRRPFIGLIIVVVSEYIRIGSLIPDLGTIRFSGMMAGFLIIGWLKELFLIRNIRIAAYPQNLAQLGFFSSMALSGLFAHVQFTALKVLLMHLGIIVLYFIIVSTLTTQDKMRRFIWFFLLANAYLAVLGLYNYFVLNRDIDNLATGGFVGGGDDFAVVLSSAIPFAFFLYQGQINKKAKLFYCLLTILLVTAVICAFSRGGWLTLIGIFFLLVFFSSYKKKTIVLISAAFVIILLIIPPTFVDEFKTINTETSTAKQRFELWKGSFKIFLDYPLTGVGMMNFPGVYGRYYMPENPNTHRWLTMHSTYFQVISELGLLGTIFFVLIIYWVIKDNLIIQKKLKSADQIHSFPYAISQGLIVSILGFLVGAVFLSMLYYPPLYIIAALTAALRRIVENDVLKKDLLKSAQLLTPNFERQNISFSNV